MARDLEVEARLTVKDELSKKAGTALDAVGKKARTAGKAADALTAPKKDAGARAYERTAQAADKAAAAIDKVARSADWARDAKGRFVSASGSGLGRVAQDAARAERSMGRLEAMARRTGTALAKVGGAMGTARDAGAGLMAGGYVAKRALEKPVSREKQILSTARIFYGDRDTQGIIEGAKEIDQIAKDAVAMGGGSDEEALNAINVLAAANMTAADVKAYTPMIQKTATATVAPPEDIAKVVVAGVQGGWFKTEQQVYQALEMMSAAADTGSFEVGDMAKWAPEILNRASGDRSIGRFGKILSQLQAVRSSTASGDQAGNAYSNALAYVTSPEANVKFQKITEDIYGEGKGISLSRKLIEAQGQGKDQITAFAALADTYLVATNRTYQRLKRQEKTATGDELVAVRSQLDLARQAIYGEVVGDKEAGLAINAVATKKSIQSEVTEALKNSSGALDKGFTVMTSATAESFTQLSNRIDYAASNILETVKGPLRQMTDGLVNAATEFPNLTAGVVAATVAFGAFTAAAGAGSIFKTLRGGGAGKLLETAGKAPLAKGAAEAGKTAVEMGGGAALKGTALEAGGKAVADATAKGIAKETMQAGAKALGKTVPLVEFGMAAYEIAETESNPNLTRQQKDQANMATYGGLGGTLAGAAGGAAAGSVVPVLGTTVGALIGGLFGWWAGRQAGEGAGKLIYSDPVSKAQTEERQPIELNAKLALEVDGLTLAEVMEKYQTEYNFRSN